MQVCLLHGDPTDIVGCPFVRCQGGRVPQWTGYGSPAGTRQCTVCNGRGEMTRAERERVVLPIHDRYRPACICHHVRACKAALAATDPKDGKAGQGTAGGAE